MSIRIHSIIWRRTARGGWGILVMMISDLEAVPTTHFQSPIHRHAQADAVPMNQTRIHSGLQVKDFIPFWPLKILPKMSVMNVQLRMITLYGIEKSGVGRSTRSVGVYIRCKMLRTPPKDAFPTGNGTGKRTAEGRSQPRIASGGCSVYLRNVLLGLMERRRVRPPRIASVAWSVYGPWCPSARRSGRW